LNARELLERAIEAAHAERPDPLECIECGCNIVVAVYRPGLGWIPQDWHYGRTASDSCPVTGGGVAAWQRFNDVTRALEPWMLVAHYGEVSEAVMVVAG